MKALIVLSSLFLSLSVQAQENFFERYSSDVYRINKVVTVSLSAGLLGTNILGQNLHKRKHEIPANTLLRLRKSDINPFDHSVFNQSAAFRNTAVTLSDLGMFTCFAMPLVLAADKEIRNDWLDLLLLYAETEMIASNLYSWGGPQFVDRYRPIAYFSEVPLEERSESIVRNSFFSGHATSAASASFFTAKVYCDYHP